jgi:hypothetical protein
VPQGIGTAKKPFAGLHLHHHGVFQQGHTGGELQGPPGQVRGIQGMRGLGRCGGFSLR